jgi:hypothetical protein
MRQAFTAALLLASLAGCHDPTQDGEHVWKPRTDTIDRARATQQLLEDAQAIRERQIGADAQ